MAATLNHYSFFTVTLNGKTVSAGSLTVPTSVAIGGQQHVQSFSVAQDGIQKVFDVSEDLADFDYMWIEADQDIEIEYVVANGGNEVVSTLKAVANVPFTLSSDVARDSAHAEDWGTDGAADTIDKVTIVNKETTTANVYVYVFT